MVDPRDDSEDELGIEGSISVGDSEAQTDEQDQDERANDPACAMCDDGGMRSYGW